MPNNIILMADSYKVGHWLQYPPGTENVYSYFESRGGQWEEVVFFGLQYMLKQYLAGKVVTEQHISEAKSLFYSHLSSPKHFNEEGWRYILDAYDGMLPVEIRAVQEGTVVSDHNVLMTIENTDPHCFWLTNYLETILSQAWYPCTIATQSREMKRIIKRYLEDTGTPGDIEFKLFDFGYRGSTSQESASIGGAAHMLNFQASETLSAIALLREHYNADMPSFSAPAAEHSTIVSWGKEHEADAYLNMLRQFPEGLVAVVSDSYDVYTACEEIWGKQLREMVSNRNGTLAVRPDSGDPSIVLPRVLNILGEAFGYTLNSKGYQVLPSYIRVFQGDMVEYASLERILKSVVQAGWSIDNVAFGSGGGLLQKVNRDTLKFAFKCSSIRANGKERDVWKDPVTDPEKASKRGRLALVHDGIKWHTIRAREADAAADHLHVVFRNGRMMSEQSFVDIRRRAFV